MENKKRVQFSKELFEVYGIEAVVYRSGGKPQDVLVSSVAQLREPVITIFNNDHYTHLPDGLYYESEPQSKYDLFIEVPTEDQSVARYLVTYEGHAACLVERHELIHILAFMMAEFTDPEKEPKKDFSLTIKSVKDGTDN
jgi:hypothetical protein